jgi:hypothetical protein
MSCENRLVLSWTLLLPGFGHDLPDCGEGDLFAGFGLLNSLLLRIVRPRGSRQEVGRAVLDGQIRNFCGFELLGHAHEVLRHPFTPAELSPEPRAELPVYQEFLDGFLDAFSYEVGGGPDPSATFVSNRS